MAVVINAGRLDFDRKLDFTKLKDACGGELTMFDDDSPSPEAIAERASGHAVVVSKEVPVDVNLLPDTVKLICEAGTGYNNIDLAAARARGITVCNVPSYSTDAVAHLVITFVLNFSATVVPQHVALAKGDRSLFTSSLGTTPHFELTGKTIGLVGGTGALGTKAAEVARVERLSPPAFSPACKACTSRRPSFQVGSDARKQSSMAISTSSPASQLPATARSPQLRWPAQSPHWSPVQQAVVPLASISCTCRNAR